MSCPPPTHFHCRLPLTLLLTCLALAAICVPAVTYAGTPKFDSPKNSKSKTYLGSDVLATVQGEPITRRDFTTFWLKVDNMANRSLGMILLNRIRAKSSLAPNYTVSEADIYQALYGGPPTDYSTFLSNLVTNHLVAQEAKRKHVVVTRAEAEQAGRELMQQARKQQALMAKMSDEEILVQFHVPRDLYMDQMTFQLRGERLLAQSFAERNGHPLGAEDWVVLRELFAAANIGTNEKKNAQEFADAKTRVQKWAAMVQGGKPFKEVAGAHNEDETRTSGGERGPALRGTGTKAIEEAVFKLKSGEMSVPLRTKDGWFIFLVEKRGTQIPESERKQLWKQIVEKRVTPFLAELRKNAKITSAIPLPADTLTNSPTTAGNK